MSTGILLTRTDFAGYAPLLDSICHNSSYSLYLLISFAPVEVDHEGRLMSVLIQRERYMTLGTIAPMGDDAGISLPAATS